MNSKPYIFGNVVCVIGSGGDKGLYLVEWEHTILGSTKLGAKLLYDGIHLASMLDEAKQSASKNSFLISERVLAAMTTITDPDEYGVAADSDTEPKRGR